MKETPLQKLKNLGPTIIRRLNEIGIYTKEDLIIKGSINAYKEIVKKHNETIIPISYYLYAIHGALTNTPWDKLPLRVRQDLHKRARL